MFACIPLPPLGFNTLQFSALWELYIRIPICEILKCEALDFEVRRLRLQHLRGFACVCVSIFPQLAKAFVRVLCVCVFLFSPLAQGLSNPQSR